MGRQSQAQSGFGATSAERGELVALLHTQYNDPERCKGGEVSLVSLGSLKHFAREPIIHLVSPQLFPPRKPRQVSPGVFTSRQDGLAVLYQARSRSSAMLKLERLNR